MDADPLAPPPPDATLDQVRRWAFDRALHLEGGDKKRTARRLGISLKSVYNWLTARGLRTRRMTRPANPRRWTTWPDKN